MAPVLEIRNLTTQFNTREGVVRAVDDISLTLQEGEVLGIVGESGSGKSVSMLSVMRLVPEPSGQIVAGKVLFGGRDLLQIDEDEMEQVRGAQIAMIFQDPMTSLNPTLTVGFQIRETLKLHQRMSDRQARHRAAALLDMVGIPRAQDRLDDYPHQFSGGMRQRAMIAMGLSCTPRVLIADEPTTALDVTIQAQIIDLVRRLQRELGMAVIWITHDLGVVARLTERVLVMYAGAIVEDALVDDLFDAPRHPYTLGLLASLPRLDQAHDVRLYSIPGQPPHLALSASGMSECRFAPRCAFVQERCRREKPHLQDLDGGHRVACWENQATQGRQQDV